MYPAAIRIELGFIFMLFLLSIFLAIPVLIGVYVYRDANRRGLNAVVWTLIAIVAPAFIGFIIYLLVRGNYLDLECPKCSAPVTEQYVVCPQCGAKLRPTCPSCSSPIEPGWKVCPMCATPLDGMEVHLPTPKQRKDKPLSKILIAILIVPVVLIILTIFSFSALRFSAGPSSLEIYSFDEYDQMQTSKEVRDAVHRWLDGLEIRSDRAYALRYAYPNEMDTGYDYFYLVYIPDGGGHNIGFGTNSGLFGTTLELSAERTGNSGILYCIQTWAEKQPLELNVTLNGGRIRCDVTVVDYNPTLFFIEPNYAHAEPNAVDLPERLSVVKIVDNTNVGVAEVENEDVMFKILASIYSEERVPMEQISHYDFKDGFEIIVEYEIHEELITHPDMGRHMVIMVDGTCWLNDDRVTDSANGSSFRMMDEDFYRLLEDLFQ